MASPRIFISSTCYDLKYIRENLKYFITTLGYEPILSEDGSVFYNPKVHTHDSCLNEVPNCQLFVLIIGGRFGGNFKDTDFSITNAEYKEACKQKIPIFTLVDQAVYNEHHVYTKNKKNLNVKAEEIIYPSTDNVKIFEFIDEVRLNAVNNALVPFRNYSDIEDYLRKQWAGMMFTFLTKQNEEDRISDTLTMLSKVNERIEILSRQILNSVGSNEAIVTVKLYNQMIQRDCISDLNYWNIAATPVMILQNEEFDELVEGLGKRIIIDPGRGNSITSSGEVTKIRLNKLKVDFHELRNKMLEILTENNIPVEDYIKNQRENNSK